MFLLGFSRLRLLPSIRPEHASIVRLSFTDPVTLNDFQNTAVYKECSGVCPGDTCVRLIEKDKFWMLRKRFLKLHQADPGVMYRQQTL